MNVYLPNLRLPSEYQEVEWIGRNGNNYIDTLWIPKQTVWFTIKIWYKISQSWWRHCILSNYWTVSWLPSNYQWAISLETNASNAARFFTTSWTQWVEFTSSNTLSTSDFYDIVFSTSGNSSWTIEVNSTTTTWSIYTWTYYNCSWWLFVDRNSRYSTFYNSYISYCKIYEAWTLVRDFVPCYRKSDSVIWLYDLVNNQFYTNSWTGTFSKWSDVTMAELKNAYIGNWLS